MRIKKGIITIIFLGIILVSSKSYAKYKYNFEDKVISLSRDATPINYTISYSTEEWTNGNVVITIKTNKPIEQVSGFQLSEDGTTLSKEVSQNESGTIHIRDLSGNDAEVEYAVNNIDKEAPQIIGCQDGGTYSAPLSLDYTDNVEIKSIKVNSYGDSLRIKYSDTYKDNSIYLGIDRSQSSLRINVSESPLNTEKYKYYLDDKLCATTTDRSFVYSGLNKGTIYKMAVEAIDEFGNILEKSELNVVTGYFESVEGTKSNNEFVGKINGLESEVAKVRYAVWNDNYSSQVKWYDATINNHNTSVNCKVNSSLTGSKYKIHAYLYNSNGSLLEIVGFAIDFQANYVVPNYEINKNLLTEKGKYQIKVTDLAGNEVVYYIKVE